MKTIQKMQSVIAPSLALSRQLRRNEALRGDDDELLRKAEEKRARKAAKRSQK